MKKNDVNSCKLPKCYPVSYDSHAYTKPRMTENFTADDATPSLLSESSFQETLTTLFPDQKYAILGGVIVVLIIIILFMLLSGGGNRHHRRHRRRDDDDDDDN